MLNIARWIALIAAVVLFAALAVVIVSPRPSPPSSEQTAAEKHQQESSAQEGYKTLWDAWFPDSISVYTLFLALFTLLLAIGGLYQLNLLGRAERITARSAEAAKQAADATTQSVKLAREVSARELRAYVWMDISARSYPPPPQQPNRYAVSLSVINSGKSWARNVRIRRMLVTDPTSDPFDPAVLDKQQTSPMVLGPGQRLDLQFGDIPLSDLPRIASGAPHLFYVAWLTYEDVLSDPPVTRQTQLSRSVNADTEGPGHVSFSWMPTHNCADEGCP
jgi:hypothetical protein